MSITKKSKQKLIGMILRLRKDIDNKEMSIENHIKTLDEYRQENKELKNKICNYEEYIEELVSDLNEWQKRYWSLKGYKI